MDKIDIYIFNDNPSEFTCVRYQDAFYGSISLNMWIGLSQSYNMKDYKKLNEIDTLLHQHVIDKFLSWYENDNI